MCVATSFWPYHVASYAACYGTADLGVAKNGKFSGVIKGRFYMTTSLSDSWEAFTSLYAGATL